MIAPHGTEGWPESMTGERLRANISAIADEAVAGEGPVIRFRIGDAVMVAIYDEARDRMRVIRPVLPLDKVTADQRDAVLEANFHSALDARYAVSDGMLYAVFLHPLSSLTERDLASGIEQTRVLASTFGTDYSSGALHFGG